MLKLLMFMWNLSELDRFIPRLKAMSKIGVKFTIICSNFDITEAQFDYYEMFLDMHKVEFNKFPSFGKWLFSKKKIFNKLKKSKILDDIDAIFCLSGLWFQYYSGYFAKRLGKPYILFLRGNDTRARQINTPNLIKRFFRKMIYENFGWNCDLVIPITQGLVSLAENFGVSESKITKPIRGGIDTELFTDLNVKKPRFVVGYAGRINKEKGSAFLQELIYTNPDIDFNIAGSIQTEFLMTDNVSHWGQIPHETMPAFYNACNIIIMTSLIEGFPRVLLEAYACGVPALVTRESIPNDCEIHGLVLPRELDLWNYAFQFMTCVTDYTLLNQKAREYALQFSLETYAKEMKKQLQKVC